MMQGDLLDVLNIIEESDSDLKLKEFYIPNYILVPQHPFETVLGEPKFPVLVFINSKSGGHLGGELLKTYRILLNENQVFVLNLIELL